MYRLIIRTLIAILTCQNLAFAEIAASRVSKQVTLEPSKTAVIQATITAFMEKNQIPGAALAVYDHGRPSIYYFGYANREKKVPVTPDTIFEIGSITKVFTSLLIAHRINTGKMHLHDPIAPYLIQFSPAFKQKFKSITLENLETHTSGLPFDVPTKINTPKKLQQFSPFWRAIVPAGMYWHYSNVNIGLLGYALTTSTKQSYDSLCRKEILIPLGMQPIGLTVPNALVHWVAQGYDAAGKPRPIPVNMKLFPAAGAMKASGRDMLLFLRAALRLPGTPTVIDKAMLLTQTPYASTATMQQGLTWLIYPLSLHKQEALLQPPPHPTGDTPIVATVLEKTAQQFNPNALIDKTGTTGGFRAYIALIPQRQSGIVLLVNRRITNEELIPIGRQILFNL